MGVKGDEFPLQGQGTASLVGYGATPHYDNNYKKCSKFLNSQQTGAVKKLLSLSFLLFLERKRERSKEKEKRKRTLTWTRI